MELQKNHVSEDCINLIRSLMAPKPRDRLLASQALRHPWFTMDEESEPESAVVNNNVSTACMVLSSDLKTQSTQPSAAWTQATVRDMEGSSDHKTEGLRESQGPTGVTRTRMGILGAIADVGFNAKMKTEGPLGFADVRMNFEARDDNASLCGHRSADLDEEVHARIKEFFSARSETSGPHGDTPPHCTYMEDADEDGNPIEGTIVYTKHAHQQTWSATSTKSLEVPHKQNQKQNHLGPRSTSPLGQKQRVSERTIQDSATHTSNGHPNSSRHLRSTETMADNRDQGRSAQSTKKFKSTISELHVIPTLPTLKTDP